jgi:hypothetical protein
MQSGKDAACRNRRPSPTSGYSRNFPMKRVLLFLPFWRPVRVRRRSPTMLSPYRIDVRQGNFVTQDMVAQLKPGLSREQVRFILGSPLVADMFHADRWDYVYRFQPGHGEVSSARLDRVFPGQQADARCRRRGRRGRRQGRSAQADGQDHRHSRGRPPPVPTSPGKEVRHGKDPLRHCRQFRAHGPHPDRSRAAGFRRRTLSAALEHASSPFLGKDAGELVGAPCGVRITPISMPRWRFPIA